MPLNLRPALSRLLAASLLAVVIGSIYLLAMKPLADRYFGLREAIVQSQDLLARYWALSLEGGSLSSEAQELQAARAVRPAYLSGGSDALAAAKLQARVEQLTAHHGGQLQAVQALPSVSEEGFKRITVRVQLSAGIEPLRQILYALEGAQPYLFLDNLEIRRGRSGSPGVVAGSTVNTNAAQATEPLAVRLDVSGFAVGQDTGAEPSAAEEALE